VSAIRTRPPTGRVPWPLILLEGPEKSGKSWSAAVLSASEKVGQTYWIDLGEGAADEYGAVPGARYLVVEHDGTWASIIGQVRAVREEAEPAASAGEPPVVLVVDSMTSEWELLKDWAGNRAKTSQVNRKRLAEDPNAEVSVPMNLWNDATARHRRLMTLLMTFPGIVVITARGKDVAAMDAKGSPIPGTREYKVEGHKTLPYDASVWVRLARDDDARVIGARSVHAGVRPGRDAAKPLPQDWTLEWLIFDGLKCGADSHARQVVQPQAGAEPPDLDQMSEIAQELLDKAEEHSSEADLMVVWRAITATVKAGQISPAEEAFLRSRVQKLKAELLGEASDAA
jgi:hypothetical protein